MFDVLFPYSYIFLLLGFFIGIGITSVIVGFVSTGIVLLMISIGMIRITPLLEFFTRALMICMPSFIASMKHTIRESFKVRFTGECQDQDMSKKTSYIYAWHPHGIFSMSHFFHIATSFTNWPVKQNIKAVALSGLQWLPFAKDLFEYTDAIPSNYNSMKSTLESNHSISVSVGGMREMLGHDYIVKRRRGIFKMALETGTPIVPVLSFGEEKLFDIVHIPLSIQNFLKPYDICICIPTWRSFTKWVGIILSDPLKDPITSVVGSPIPVETIAEPTEDDISQLRERYIAALKDLFEKENPDKSAIFRVI